MAHARFQLIRVYTNKPHTDMDVSTGKPNKDFCSDPSMAIYTMLSHHGILDLVVITNILGIAKDRLNVIGCIGTFFQIWIWESFRPCGLFVVEATEEKMQNVRFS